MSLEIWEGVYSSFREAPSGGAGFSSPTWSEKSLARLRELRAPEAAAVPQAVAYSSTLLHAVAALTLAETPRLKILDFGGGLGLTYASLLKAAGDPKNIEFHVVENPEVCAEGRREFANDARVSFHESLPELNGVDIVHAQSSLQYIDDWKGLLGRLAAYGARRMILTDVPAGEFPTYASAQNYYGSRIPCWFFNAAEFLAALDAAGYRTILRTRFLGPYLGSWQDHPMDNFPAEKRVGRSCSFMLERRAA
jgi:putative methyltransferase (TIGR04325 family)